jgi:hypothetical protein
MSFRAFFAPSWTLRSLSVFAFSGSGMDAVLPMTCNTLEFAMRFYNQQLQGIQSKKVRVPSGVPFAASTPSALANVGYQDSNTMPETRFSAATSLAFPSGVGPGPTQHIPRFHACSAIWPA